MAKSLKLFKDVKIGKNVLDSRSSETLKDCLVLKKIIIHHSSFNFRHSLLKIFQFPKSIRSRYSIKNAILTHQKSTLLFYYTILQYLIYQIFYHSILYIKIIFTTH